MSAKDTKRIEGDVRIAPCAGCGRVRQVSGSLTWDKGKVVAVQGPRLCGLASCRRQRNKRFDRAAKLKGS